MTHDLIPLYALSYFLHYCTSYLENSICLFLLLLLPFVQFWFEIHHNIITDNHKHLRSLFRLFCSIVVLTSPQHYNWQLLTYSLFRLPRQERSYITNRAHQSITTKQLTKDFFPFLLDRKQGRVVISIENALPKTSWTWKSALNLSSSTNIEFDQDRLHQSTATKQPVNDLFPRHFNTSIENGSCFWPKQVKQPFFLHKTNRKQDGKLINNR